MKGNICDPETLEDAMRGHDTVVHFAAESHVDRSIVGPDDFIHTNCFGTNVVMDTARRLEIGRVVHIGTDEVYGSVEAGSSAETDPLEPRSPYSASKAGSDLIALSYHHTYGLPVSVTRCTNNFGPYQYPEKAIPLFTTNLLDGGKDPALRRRPQRARLDLRRRPLRGRADRARRAVSTARSTTSARATRRRTACWSTSCWRCSARARSRCSTSTDRLGHDRRYSVDIAKVTALGWQRRAHARRGARGDGRVVPRQPLVVGTAEAARRRHVMDHPSVGVVVVNYNGGDLTMACLRSMLEHVRGRRAAAGRPGRQRVGRRRRRAGAARSSRPSGARESRHERRLRRRMQRGHPTPLGDVDFVALVNNDATVEPGWLAPAGRRARDRPRSRRRVPEDPVRRTVRRRRAAQRHDRAAAGVTAATSACSSPAPRVDDDDVLVARAPGRRHVGAGARRRDGAEWTGAGRAPPGPGCPPERVAATASLLLSADATASGGAPLGRRRGHAHGRAPSRHGSTSRHAVPASTSSTMPAPSSAPAGSASIAGSWNPTTAATTSRPTCSRGAAPRCCSAAEYLDDVGLFDEDLFLYYEDLELAWRGSSHGWRYRYVPTSVAHHVHAASSVSGSAFKQYFDERNHLLVLSRHGAPTDAARAIGRSLLVTASYARRDLIAPMLAGRSPHAQVVQARLRAWGGFVRRFPGALTRRRHDRRTAHSNDI